MKAPFLFVTDERIFAVEDFPGSFSSGDKTGAGNITMGAGRDSAKNLKPDHRPFPRRIYMVYPPFSND